jgi:Tol biopolymer transport system component
MPLIAGFQLDSYEIIALLGAGGMGEVYRARDAALKRDVAIKVLPAEWSRDTERLRRFELEAQAAAALNHPNIVSIFHVGQFDGSPYIVTELLQGETLREHLRKGPMRLREVLDYGVELARGLAAAHDAGIVHRDLKPENIWVTKDGRIKILDFGLAKLNPAKIASLDGATASFRQESVPGQVLGTVGYMSPEQVRGEVADARSDIFAVGVVLYEMLAGKPAFRKATSAETMAAILHEDPPAVSQIAPSVPPGLQRIVNRCLAKNPAQRLQHATDLEFALEALSDSGTGTQVTGSHATVSPVKRRWIAASAAVLGIVAAFIIWWTRAPEVPVVRRATQLTDDGIAKEAYAKLATDGPRVYFTEGAPGSASVAQVAATGGPTAVLPGKIPSPHIAAISPDASSLLVDNRFGKIALWTVPLPAGEPRSIGDIEADADPTYLPDGRILFIRGTDFYVAEKDGSNSHKLISTGSSLQDLHRPTVSPDGTHIAFVAGAERHVMVPSIMEINADGSDLRTIAKSADGTTVCCPNWTRDGRYIVYSSVRRESSDLWTCPAEGGIMRRSRTPVQLTNGPLRFSQTVSSLDGKQLFTVGTKNRGELVRYDSQSKQFVPILSGISAFDVTYSVDGKWVAYLSYPEGDLWRSRADGSERVQLTYPPMDPSNPFISPDGKQVAFSTHTGGLAYVISMNGGTPQRIGNGHFVSPNWSPDGMHLAATTGEHRDVLQLFDLQAGAFSPVFSSRGFNGGQWVGPNQVVARSTKNGRMMILDVKTKTWSDLGTEDVGNFAHSLDYKYLYYATYYATVGPEPKAMRIRLADRKIEFIASLKDFRWALGGGGHTQISVAPDGSPIFTRNIGTQEIYALTVKWP